MTEAPSPRKSEDEADSLALQPRTERPSSGPDGSRAVEALIQAIAPGALVSAQRSQLESGALSTSAGLVQSSEKKVYKKCIFPQAPAESQILVNLIASTHQQVENSCPQGYVKTPALDAVINHLEEKGACLILGVSGHGKSTLALQAMDRVASDHNMQPVCLGSPGDWQHLPGDVPKSEGNGTPLTGEDKTEQGQSNSEKPSEASRSRRYVVLVDDMFGKGNFSERRLEDWEDKFAAMLAKVQAGQIKLIMVSRTHIFQHCRDRLMQNELFKELDIVQLQDENCWNESCEIGILQAMLKRHGVESEIPGSAFREAYSCPSLGFPQCCEYFASNPGAQKLGVEFFENPLAFLQREIKAMKKSDKKGYFVLILTLRHNGHLSESFLSDDSAVTTQELVSVGNVCGQNPPLNLGEVRETAESLCGVYLTRSFDGDGYRLSHWSLSDCLMVEMCQTNLKFALDVCSFCQLFEYIRTEGCMQNKEDTVYVVPKHQWPKLADRLVKEMIGGENFLAVLRHPCLQDEDFTQKLLKHIRSDGNTELIQKQVSTNLISGVTLLELDTAPAAMILEKKTKLARHLLFSKEMAALPDPQKISLLQEALTAACFTADMDLARLLLSRGATASEEAVEAVCISMVEKVELLKLIYEKVPSLKKKQHLFETATLLSCLKDKVECVKYLLHEAPRPRDIEASSSRVMNMLFFTTHPGLTSNATLQYPNCLALFFEELRAAGGRVDPKINVNFAAGHTDSFVLEQLINKGADFETVHIDSLCPLMNACIAGSEESVRVIIGATKKKGKPVDVNIRDCMKKTPLHAAAFQNNAKIVDILLQNGADPNAVDTDGQLPLHHCVGGLPNQSLDVLTCLLEKTSDPLHQDCNGKTPLHIAAERCNYPLMKLLLAKDEEREKCGLRKASDVEDKFKMRPLHIHCSQSYNLVGIADNKRRVAERILVKMASDINAQDIQGKTALHLAAEICDFPLLQLLMDRRARADIPDSGGACAVHSLCGSKTNTTSTERKERLLKEMLKGKVDVNLRDALGRTPLLLAAEADASLVKTLVQHKAQTDVSDNNKDTVLHYLARHAFQPQDKHVPVRKIFPDSNADFSVVEMLTQKNEILNSTNAAGDTPLHVAAAYGNHQLLKELISLGAKVHILNHDQKSVLHCFCSRMPWNDKHVTSQLFTGLTNMDVDVNSQDKQGCTPLHYAAANLDFSSIEVLLDLQAAVDVLNCNEELALHCYARGQSSNPYTSFTLEEIKQTEKLMLEKTKDINHQTLEGATILHWAAATQKLSLAKALLEKHASVDLVDKRGFSALHAYAFAPEGFWTSFDQDSELRQDVEDLLLDNASHPLSPDKGGATVLHYAAGSGCWTLLQALLERGGQLDACDKMEWLPLHYLASRNMQQTDEVVTQLVESTTNLNKKTSDGCSALFVAADYSNWPVAEALIRKGADVNLCNSRNQKPLHAVAEAAMSPTKRVLVQMLVDRDTDLNCQDDNGQTPLHLAILSGDYHMTTLLLQKGARTDVPNAKKETPVHLLAGSQSSLVTLTHSQVTSHLAEWKGMNKLVVENTEDINSTDSEGRTALHRAAAWGNFHLTEALLEKDALTDRGDRQMCIPLHLCAGMGKHYMENTEILSLLSLDPHTTRSFIDKKRAQDALPKTSGNTSMMPSTASVQMASSLQSPNNNLELPFPCQMRVQYTEETDPAKVETALLQRTKNINARNAMGQTPLHLAAGCRNIRFMEKLIQQGADVNAVDDRQNTPLHLFAFADFSKANKVTEPASENAADSTRERWQHMETVLVNQSDDINKQNTTGWTPLHLAAANGRDSLVEILLIHAARENLEDSERKLPLHMSATAKPMSPCKEEITVKNSDVNKQDRTRYTPLHFAIAHRNASVAKMLLHCSASINSLNQANFSLLCMFARRKIFHYHCLNKQQTEESDIEKLILEEIDDINSIDSEGMTALHVAADVQDFALIETLLLKKARTDLRNAHTRTALHHYAMQRIPEWKIRRQSIILLPEEVALKRRVDELFVEMTEDVNAQDDLGCIPLHYAASNDDVHLMKVLMSRGASCNLKTNQGANAIHLYAERNVNKESARLLEVSSLLADQALRDEVERALVKESPADPTPDHLPCLPLQQAARLGDFSLLEKFLEITADTSAREGGTTLLLMYAGRPRFLKTGEAQDLRLLPIDAYSDTRLRVDRLMVEKAADVDMLTREGNTALHLAAQGDDLSLVEQLLKRGASADVQNEEGALALHLFASRTRVDSECFRQRRRPVSELLVEKTTKLSVKDKEGRSPLDLAKIHDDFLLIQLLSDRGEM